MLDSSAGIITVSQGDRVILKGKKCEELYKLKEENSVRDGVSGINLEGSLWQGGLQGKLQWDVNGSKCCEKEKGCNSSKA